MNVVLEFLEKAVINRLESFYQQEVGVLVDAAALAVFSILVLVVLVAVFLKNPQNGQMILLLID